MRERRIVIALIVLSVLGVLIVYMLAQEHHFGMSAEKTERLNVLSYFSRSACGERDTFINCRAVNASPYATVFSIPQTSFGMFYFLAMGLLTVPLLFLDKRGKSAYFALLFWPLALGSAYCIIMLIISIFFIHALCLFCTAVYIINWVSLALLWHLPGEDRMNPLRIACSFAVIKDSLKAERRTALAAYTAAALILSMAGGFFLEDYFTIVKKSHFQRERLKIIAGLTDRIAGSPPLELHASPVCVIGNVSAPVIIVEFSDFLCPHCKTASETIKKAAAGFGNNVGIIFMNLPLDKSCNPYIKRTLHEGACELAKGAICASWQLRFDEFQEAVFSLHPDAISPEVMRQIAALSLLNVPRFESCMTSGMVKKELKKQIEESRRLHINSTPSVLINGKPVAARIDSDLIAEIIRKELAYINRK